MLTRMAMLGMRVGVRRIDGAGIGRILQYLSRICMLLLEPPYLPKVHTSRSRQRSLPPAPSPRAHVPQIYRACRDVGREARIFPSFRRL